LENLRRVLVPALRLLPILSRERILFLLLVDVYGRLLIAKIVVKRLVLDDLVQLGRFGRVRGNLGRLFLGLE
jgi:hypothetical protein